VRRAPSLHKADLEWVFRSMIGARRLWERYAKHNPRLAGLFLAHLPGLRNRNNGWCRQVGKPRSLDQASDTQHGGWIYRRVWSNVTPEPRRKAIEGVQRVSRLS
jgi:hypothetical protein